MKIVFIIDQVYLHGGIERVLSIKANYFAENEAYEVHILTTEQKNNTACYYFHENIIFKDLKINYNRKKSYFHPVNLKKLPKHIQALKSNLKRIKPDIVVVCSHSTDTYFIPFINKNIPKIKEFHYSKHIEQKGRKNPRNLLKKYFYKFADYVESKYDKLIILNQDEIKYYKTNNTTVVPNPLTFFPDKISNTSEKRVIAAGRIAPVKGYDILIDIWNIVHKKNKDWVLNIYGHGEPSYIGLLQDKINKYGLQEVVFLKGSTNNIEEKMLNSSIFVMTSHNECFPLVLLEAQACGLPIIAFDCPSGPRNIINRENGSIIELYDNEAFALKLLSYMNNMIDLERLGINARINSSLYSIERVMKKWENIFNILIIKKL